MQTSSRHRLIWILAIVVAGLLAAAAALVVGQDIEKAIGWAIVVTVVGVVLEAVYQARVHGSGRPTDDSIGRRWGRSASWFLGLARS